MNLEAGGVSFRKKTVSTSEVAEAGNSELEAKIQQLQGKQNFFYSSIYFILNILIQ